jgi:predicted metalloendopeptidase
MDGLNGDQRFFFGWVQAWRGKQRDDALRRTFDVKEGDKMFLPPAQRAKIW